MVTRGRAWWEGKLDKGIQGVQTYSCKINKYWDVMYTMIIYLTLLYVIYESCRE